MSDLTEKLQAQLTESLQNGSPVSIHGSGSQNWLLGDYTESAKLDLSAHRGIIDYQPSELYIRARAGTPLAEIEQTLAKNGQQLPTDFPRASEKATLGGAIASGMTGSGRPFLGAPRDHVLGCCLMNGRAEVLNFGGQVMKNVAGYDVSRLMTGSYGTLAVLLDITLKVLPRAEAQRHCVLELSAEDAIARMHALAGQALPITACAWSEGKLHVRLQGANVAVDQAATTIGGSEENEAADFWSKLNRFDQPIFTDEACWRAVLPSNSAQLDDKPGVIIDWCGGLHWYPLGCTDLPEKASRAGGYAQRFASSDAAFLAVTSSAASKLQQQLKNAFDPDGLFNPKLFAATLNTTRN